jgi:hypothetical protein
MLTCILTTKTQSEVEHILHKNKSVRLNTINNKLPTNFFLRKKEEEDEEVEDPKTHHETFEYHYASNLVANYT